MLEESITVFDAFECWLYTGTLKDPPSDLTTATKENEYLEAIELCRIWVFADMRGIPGLANTAIDMYQERIVATWATNSAVLDYIYQSTTPGSKLRKFIVDEFTKTMDANSFMIAMTPDNSPTEFLLEAIPPLMEFFWDRTTYCLKDWTCVDRCEWHDHSGPGGKLRHELRKRGFGVLA